MINTIYERKERIQKDFKYLVEVALRSSMPLPKLIEYILDDSTNIFETGLKEKVLERREILDKLERGELTKGM